MLTIFAAAAIACTSLTVDAPQAYSMGRASTQTFVADFNGDGRPDVASEHLGTFTIRYNTGGGQLSEPVSLPYPVVTVADVVGDALPDLAVSNYGVRENRRGDFSTFIRTTMPLYGWPVAADFTGDGKADLLTTDGLRHVLLSFASGTPQNVTHLDLGEYRRDLEAADLDGDGDVDFIARHTHSDDYRILLNDGRGKFTDGGYRHFEGWFALADFDGDRRADRVGIVVRDGIYGGLRVFYANGTTSDVLVPGGARASDFKVLDFDGDGDPDLFVALEERPGLHVYRNDGSGRLTRVPQKLFADAVSHAADFTGDGIFDLLAASRLGGAAIIRGAGDGTFRVPQALDLPAAGHFSEVVASDVDGDGRDELIYVSATDGLVVARPDGTGGFTVERLQGAAGAFVRATRGEIAVANYQGQISIFSRRATGGWGLYRSFEASLPNYELHDFELADLNGDGRSELAITARSGDARSLRVIEVASRRVLLDEPLAAQQHSYELVVYGRLLVLTLSGTAKVTGGDPPYLEILPDGVVRTYAFKTAGVVQQTVMSNAVFRSTVAGDFNGDGSMDVLSSNLLAYGRAGGTFAPPEVVENLGDRRVAGDLNGDGITDLVIADHVGFTYLLGSRAGWQRAPAHWRSGAGGLPAIARLRADRPASLIFGEEELVEVKTHCIAPPSKRRGVRH